MDCNSICEKKAFVRKYINIIDKKHREIIVKRLIEKNFDIKSCSNGVFTDFRLFSDEDTEMVYMLVKAFAM